MQDFIYRLKQNSISANSSDYFADYLRSLGIRKVESFMEMPFDEDEESPKNLDNIEELVDALHNGFILNKTFYLQPDADVDGYTSAAIFYRYFKDLYPNAKIYWEVHDGKEHGIILKKIPVWVDIVVIPDAGSNQFEEQKELVRRNQQVLVIDHHSVDNFQVIDGVIVVNNQLSERFKNKSLSGAGVVYKVIQRYSQKYNDGKYHLNFIDLAAIGIVSDMMDTRNLDNNYIIYHGLRNIKNPLIKALLQKQSYSVSNVVKPNKIDIAFYITPLINAVVRVGTMQENGDFFQGLIDYTNTDTNVNNFRGKISVETYYDRLAREAYNTRNRQNKTKEKSMLYLDSIIQEQELDKNAIIAVISSKDDEVTLPKTMTGLVAMEFVKKYKKPVLVLRPKVIDGKKFLYGSGRANSVDGFESFRNELNESLIMDFAEGHDNAFGVGIEEEKLPLLIEYMNKNFSQVDFGSEIIDVDYIFDFEDINNEMLFEFAKHNDIYGNQIPQPKFAFKFFLNKDLIQVMGKKGNTLKINYNNLNFIKFYADDILNELSQDTTDFFIQSKNLEITIIGRPQLNEFNGIVSLQIVIDNFAFKEINKRNLL